jgi:hypothetical protein
MGTSFSQEQQPSPPRSPVRDTASDTESPSGAAIKEEPNSLDHESDDKKPSSEKMPQQLSNNRVSPSSHHRAYDDAMVHLKHSLDRAIQALSSTHHDFSNETQGMGWYITPSQHQELWLTRLDHDISTLVPLYRPGRCEWAVGKFRYATNLLSRSLFMTSMCTIETVSEEQGASYPGNLKKEWREWREWRNMARATMRQLKPMLARWDRVDELLRKLRKTRGRLERWEDSGEDEVVEGREWYFPFSWRDATSALGRDRGLSICSS